MHHYMTLVPMAGKTLAKQTINEFLSDCYFRVVSTTLVKYRRGERVQRKELLADMEHHDYHFDIRFETQSVKDFIAERAEVDYDYEVSLREGANQ